MAALTRFLPDRFLLILLATLTVATILPARGQALVIVGWISNAAIFLLFFLHGARLSRRAVLDGARRWRLHAAILGFGYGLFPLAGLGASMLLAPVLAAPLLVGLVFLGVLPTTVQSSIAYTSIARGNVAASVVAAAVSNLLGVVLVPLLLLALGTAVAGTAGAEGALKIALLLLLPFLLGQLFSTRVRPVVQRHARAAGMMDRLTIIIAVYVAFSEAANEGLWSRLAPAELAIVAGVVLAMLLCAFAAAWGLGAAIGLPREDRIALLFAASHKSLATGAPMARILLPAGVAGAAILPLMLYHQLQLMLSAAIAARLARED